MNDYRITYTSETGEESNDYVTERTESSARKAFNSAHKGMGFTIESVELHRENTCATNQQERDTLAAIRKMVEELGPQSYLATAFDGCFDDAESNIDNDFGDSMKARWDSAVQRIKALESKLKQAEQGIEELIQKDDERKAALEKMYSKALSDDDLTIVIHLVAEKRLALESEVKNAAERIVEAASEPESATFQNAVKDHRVAKSDFDYYAALLERLVHARDE